MAVHSDLESMSREAIEEYLAIAHHCVTTEKVGGVVYGYPAVLLLLSVVDAFSNYAGYPKHSFEALKDIFPDLTPNQIRQLAAWFRHLLSHQAIIMPGTQLSASEGSPIELNSVDEPTHIRVRPFYEALKRFWAEFDSAKIKPRFIVEGAPLIPASVDVSNPLTASGTTVSCLSTVAITKLTR